VLEKIVRCRLVVQKTGKIVIYAIWIRKRKGEEMGMRVVIFVCELIGGQKIGRIGGIP